MNLLTLASAFPLAPSPSQATSHVSLTGPDLTRLDRTDYTQLDWIGVSLYAGRVEFYQAERTLNHAGSPPPPIQSLSCRGAAQASGQQPATRRHEPTTTQLARLTKNRRAQAAEPTQAPRCCNKLPKVTEEETTAGVHYFIAARFIDLRKLERESAAEPCLVLSSPV